MTITSNLSDTPYDSTFYDQHADGSLRSARVVVPLVLQLVKPRSVLDVGCGVGTWLRAFVENGVEDVVGLDGDYVDPKRLHMDCARFRAMDLSCPQPLDRAFDLAVCLEVGEHIPTGAARHLVAFLVGAAPVVLFSAAIPGQGGIRHLNEQWPAFWMQLFTRHGFVRLDPFRRHIAFDERVEWYYRQNLYLFAAPEQLACVSPLQEEAEWALQNKMEVLWEPVLAPYTSFTGLLKQLPGAAWRAVKNRCTRCR